MSGFYYKAASAELIGDVRIGENSSIWYQSVLRADSNYIQIGRNSNIQDGCIVHMDPGDAVIVGDNVSVGHGVILHGCTVGDNSIIGMGSILLNGSKVGKNCMIGAGTLIPQGKVIPDNSLAFGSPVVIRRQMSEEECAGLLHNAGHYVELAGGQLEKVEIPEE